MKPILMVVAAMAVALIISTACKNQPKALVATVPEGRTQVLYFHAKQHCVTCNAIERLTREVVDSLANEGVVMRVIDISKSENRAMADKYEISWSSLILDRDGKIESLTDMGFGYAKSRPQLFKAKLSEAITKISQ